LVLAITDGSQPRLSTTSTPAREVHREGPTIHPAAVSYRRRCLALKTLGETLLPVPKVFAVGAASPRTTAIPFCRFRVRVRAAFRLLSPRRKATALVVSVAGLAPGISLIFACICCCERIKILDWFLFGSLR